MASNAHALAPPLHRLIVFADIAGFSAPQRTVADQIAVRAEFFEMMRAAFAESGVPWANCHIEDRGDGALILVPPEAGSEFMVMVLPQLLAGMLHRRNRHLQPSRRIQLRLAVHMGAVQVDGAGCVGSSIVHAARMLDASPLKRALAESAAPLALIVPESFFHGVGRSALKLRVGQSLPILDDDDLEDAIEEAADRLSSGK